MTTAATSAPTSGRARTRENIDRWGRWGAGAAGGAGGWVTTGELMGRSQGGGGGGGGGGGAGGEELGGRPGGGGEGGGWGGGRRGPAPPGGLRGVVLGVGDDFVDVGFVDEGRPGQPRPPTADVVAVGEVQP